MTNAKGKSHDLIPDPSLRVIVEIGSADACPGDPEQHVGGMLQCRGGLFHDFNFSNSCKYHGFHKVSLLKRNNRRMVLINPPLVVLVLLFDFQALIQSHRRTRLEVQCDHLLAIAHLAIGFRSSFE